MDLSDLKNMLVDKEQITQNMNKCIEAIIDCFRTYDTIMLLGGIGLRLLDNLPNIEKHFLSQMTGQAMDTDENSEVVAEYALNFGLSVPNEYREVPDESIINDLYQYLKDLKKANVDAVIVSDIAIIDLINENNIGLEMHLSTQASTLNSYAASFWKNKNMCEISTGKLYI